MPNLHVLEGGVGGWLAAEWDAGHIPGVRNIPLGYLVERLRDLPATTPIIGHCQSGARSAIAASVLETAGFGEVANLTGGFAAWAAAGHLVEQAARSEAGDAENPDARWVA